MQPRFFWLGATVILLASVPARGQMPSDILKKTTQEGWYKAVQHAITVERAKQRFNIPVSPLFAAADRVVTLDVGPPEASRLQYDMATTTVTWNLTRRPGMPPPQAAIDKVVRDFLVNVAGQSLPPLIEQKDVQADGALKIKVVLAPPPSSDVLDLMKRVGMLEAELKKLEDLRRELRKLDGIRRDLRELSEKVEELRRRLSGAAGGRATSAVITPGAVSWYNPFQLCAFHGYPAVGYSYVPAYYALSVPRTPLADSDEAKRVREQLEQLGRSLSVVAQLVNGVYEVAFGKEAAALEPAADLRGLGPRDAGLFAVFGFGLEWLVSVRGPGPRDAETYFVYGIRLYWEGEYAESLSSLRMAVALRDADARYWSFKALAERALGQRAAAVASARKALDLRKLDLPDPDTFGEALERVQGAERRFLNAP
jgi:hypothetical protein